MKSIEWSTAGREQTTRVVIEAGALAHAGEALASWRSSSVLIVTDETVRDLHVPRLMPSMKRAGLAPTVHALPAGEKSKSWGAVSGIHEHLASTGMTRDGLLLALGGGVVSDVTGFAAATWMRGVRYVTVPTTMEAMVDASIGGKTGINLPAGKNLAGAFHSPSLVLIDPTTLSTLPPRDVRAGLAESIKHALVFDEPLVTWHERNVRCVLALEAEALTDLIWRNVQIKSGVVRADPFEQTGRRMLLNFGHTLGHAIEAECGYALRHGECVALGMAAALRLSTRRPGLTHAEAERGVALIDAYGLPTGAVALAAMGVHPDAESVFQRTLLDKKNSMNRRRLVLLKSLGDAEVVETEDAEPLRAAIHGLLGSARTG